MPKFSYQAKNKQGESKTGVVTAPNEDGAVSILQSHNLTVLSLKNNEKKNVFSGDIALFNKVSAKDLVIFSRLLATLLNVQVPLIEALNTLAGQTKNKFFKTILLEVISDVEDGSLLSEAMKKQPKAFSPLYVAMIQSGEVSGSLQEALEFLATYLEEQYDLNSKIKGALTYPAFVLIVFGLIGFGVMYFVLPQLVSVIKSLDNPHLPITTLAIIAISDFLQKYILLIIPGLLGLLGLVIYFFKTPQGKSFWHKNQLKLPIFGNFFTKIYVSRFSMNMYTLLKGGIPILTALKISTSVVENEVFVKIINQAIDEVKGGSTMSSAFIKHKEFPLIATQIIQVGEKTGKMDFVLKNLADFYKRELDNLIKNMTSLIEPFMIVGLGIGVGIFVVSVLLPIYDIAGNL